VRTRRGAPQGLTSGLQHQAGLHHPP
jgi:hypothetical protein